MRRATGTSWAILAVLVCFAHPASAQTSPATLDITARITPTAARPEPVRQFMFYILTKSYADIAKEVEEGNVVPPRDEFIEGLKVSKELKAWLKAHETLDLTIPDLDKMLTPDDILHTPEFLVAYQQTNGGGITSGMPKPKFKEADKTEHPEKYERDKQAYYAALKKIHPDESVDDFWDGAGAGRRKSAEEVGADHQQSEETRAEAGSGNRADKISGGQSGDGFGRTCVYSAAGAGQLLDQFAEP